MKDGILLLNKPGKWTSHDCVAICRRALRLKGVKKTGHGGTLDPMAEGLLPIFIGQATRIMEYMDLEYKTYICSGRLGITTDTQDIWGAEIGRRSTAGIEKEDIFRGLKAFEGVIEQEPPSYSAVRIGGKRLYEYAREGNVPQKEIPLRKVHIKCMEVLSIDEGEGSFCFRILCSRGTYVRTICHDLGEHLGCGAVMTALQRTAIGSMDLSGSISPEKIREMGEDLDPIDGMIIPTDKALDKMGALKIDAQRAKFFSRGNSSKWDKAEILKEPAIQADPVTGRIPVNGRGRDYDLLYRVYDGGNGRFLGIGYRDKDNGLLKADKVFVNAEQ